MYLKSMRKKNFGKMTSMSGFHVGFEIELLLIETEYTTFSQGRFLSLSQNILFLNGTKA